MLFIFANYPYTEKLKRNLNKEKVEFKFITQNEIAPFLTIPEKTKWVFLIFKSDNKFKLFLNKRLKRFLPEYKKQLENNLIKTSNILTPSDYFNLDKTNLSVAWSNIWIYLHFFIAKYYPKNPTETDKSFFSLFFNKLGETIPCILCRLHYLLLLKLNPVEDNISSYKSLVDWLLLVHNDVNTRLEKPLFSKNKLWRYNNNYHFDRFMDNFINKPIFYTPSSPPTYKISNDSNINNEIEIDWVKTFQEIYISLGISNLK